MEVKLNFSKSHKVVSAPLSPSVSVPKSLDGSVVPSVNYDGKIPQVFSRLRYDGLNGVRKRKRIFKRIMDGLKIAKIRGETTRFLTLTTHKDYDISRLSRDLDIFKKRVEHVSYEKDGFNPFTMEFVKVTTAEGNGVIHLIFKAKPVKSKFKQLMLFSHVRRSKGGVPLNHKFDIGYVDFEWIKSNWADITGNPVPTSQHVYIKKTYGSPFGISNYLIQYVSNQSEVLRMSYTHDWLYSGCVKDWKSGFAPRVAEVYSYRNSLDDEQFNADMRAVYRDWDKWISDKVVS